MGYWTSAESSTAARYESMTWGGCSMSRRLIHLAIAGALMALVLDVAVVEPSVPFVGMVVGLALVLVLPGYAMVAAIFPDRAPEMPQRLLIIVGLSIAVTILGGYTLNLTPWGLRPESWAVLLGGVTLAALAVAALRRRGHPTAGVWQPSSMHLGTRQWLLLGLAALNVTGAVVVAQVGAEKAPHTQFTQLWISEGEQQGTRVAHIGVSNQEQTALEYRLTVDVGATRITEWPSFTLGPGEKWEAAASLPAAQTTNQTVYATLYRQDHPAAIYRQVTLRGEQP